jgi:exopolyphosphatase/guanosine-5'-triphosphate,3'-diphosphate pyrophosphatase
VLSELQGKQTSQNIRVRTAQSLATRYDVDTQYAHKVLKTCMGIYNDVKQHWDLADAKYRFMLGWSALLHEVGLQVNYRSIQKHSSYILSHSDLPGFNQDQQRVMSILVRFHRKKIQPDLFPSSIEYSEQIIGRLLVVLRLGILLNINRQLSANLLNKCIVTDDGIQLVFESGILDNNPLLVADLAKESAYLAILGVTLKAS